jgi:hypothetical protein
MYFYRLVVLLNKSVRCNFAGYLETCYITSLNFCKFFSLYKLCIVTVIQLLPSVIFCSFTCILIYIAISCIMYTCICCLASNAG